MRIPWLVKVGLGGALLVASGLVVHRVVRSPGIRRAALDRLVDDDLLGAAVALAAGIGPDGLRAPDLEARVRAAGRTSRIRFTVVGDDGRVLADSDVADLGTLENHGARPEIREAREAGTATSRRSSSSVRRDLYYAAARIGDTRAVARAALDVPEAEAFVAEETRFPWLAAVIAALACGLLTALLFAPAAAAVRSVTRALRGIEEGDLSARVPTRGPEFLRGLSSAFNATAERLAAGVERARAEGARLATVLDGMVEGVLAVDASERVRFTNRAARAMFGVDDPFPAEGLPLHACLRDPTLLALVRGALVRHEDGEADLVLEGTARRLVHVHVAPVREGGTGAILLVRDVSALRRLERMRTDFVANVSHELRTPITAIAGAAETLADGALTDAEAGPGFVAAIQRHAERLRALVDDLLVLSRLESAPETIERVPLDVGSVVRQACDAVAPRAAKAGHKLDVRVPASGVRILGDVEALRRLVDNLVLNAIAYTPAGGQVRVSVDVVGAEVVLTVADTGIGIAPEHIERVFERFYRVDKARSRAQGGTGLGLAIVKHSASLHGGEVSVRSSPGTGTTFVVRLPLPRAGENGGPA